MSSKLIKYAGRSLLALGLGFTLLQSCKVSYSLSGTNIPVQIETASVQYFPNRAPLVQAQLSQLFTDELRDKIEAQTRLELVNGMGDVNFSGEIVDYETRPTAITGNETAALNRLTISVRVQYSNSFDPESNFDTRFSRYEDYESSKDLSQVEDELVNDIVDMLVEDIFNRAFVNW